MRPLDIASPMRLSMRASARICVCVACLIVGLAALGVVAMETDHFAARRTHERLAGALNDVFNEMAREGEDELAGEAAPKSDSSVAIYILAQGTKAPSRPAFGDASRLWSAITDQCASALRAARRGVPANLFVSSDGAALAVRIQPAKASGDAIAIAVRPMDAALLEKLALRAGVKSLKIAATGRSARALALPPSGLSLAWNGGFSDRAYGLFGLALASFSALFAGLIALHARKETERYAANEAAAKQLAGLDPLSGLPNRMSFTAALDAELARAARRSEKLALLYIDLDGFKEVNDYFGHEAGDRLIVLVGQRITSALRGGDRVARFGGDEFAVMLTEVHQPRDAEIVCKRLFMAMQEPFELGGREAYVGMSIGIALFPRDAEDRDELMRLADLALYRAKNEGRGRHAFFEARMGDELRLRRSVEEELKHAIEHDQLAVFYQPIFGPDARSVVGAEALVRWPHPERGMIPPDQFIGLAEDRGLIAPLGEWVLRRACIDSAKWPGLKIAVNVSPIQFRSRDFVATVSRVLAETGRDPGSVELELTESVVVENADGAEEAMMELRAMGVSLALDDFGTGYSSLIYLRRFPFDKIKIDRSFLESMEPTGESAIIVESIVSLGRSLGLTVTAEGVESEDQRRILQSFDCHQFQGYLLARPMEAGAFGRFLAECDGSTAISEEAA